MAVVRSLLIPQVLDSIADTGKFYFEHLFTANYIEKGKIKKKRPVMANIEKTKEFETKMKTMSILIQVK